MGDTSTMWLQRLNRHASHFEIEGNQWEIWGWSHSENLPDNVPHRHTYFEACLVGAHGEGVFTNEGIEHALQPGTFFLARPGAVHQIANWARVEMELYWVCFSVTRAARGEVSSLLHDFLRSPLVIMPQQQALASLWRALLMQIDKPGAENKADLITLRLLAQSVLLEIAGIGSASPPGALSEPLTPPQLEATPTASSHTGLARLGALYVHDNLERALTPDEIAHHLGVSRRQLTRLFSSHTGAPPALYIERARIDRALGLLRAGQKSIKEISHLVGYPDVHHFTRVFTRVVGTSPARYRQEGPVQANNSGPHIQKAGSLV
jgi:AraC-like DNA-binding protein/mannose-6-phosphate isomerase-like protein (cupin superfamily)